METLKLTTIRIDRESLVKAAILGRQRSYYDRSSVIRMALWVGLKIVNLQNLNKLREIYAKEQCQINHYDCSDVLRTAGIIKNEQ